MFKKSLLIMLLMAFMAPWAAKAQTTTLLEENFDAMNSTSISTSYSENGWYTYNASGNYWTLNTDNDYSYSSSKSAMYGFDSYDDADSYLVSAPFNVTNNLDELSVSLYECVRSSNYAETFEVFFVKASDLTDAASVASATKYMVIASASYSNTSFVEKTGSNDNSELAGQSVRLVVHCTSPADRWNLYIDDITVTESTTGPYITLTPTSATVLTGNTEELTATYGNVTGTPTIVYSSSNLGVATVSGNGTSATVTGVAEGTATITATMTYNATDYTATCDITVVDACQPTWSGTSSYYISKFVANSFENSSTGTARTTTNYYSTKSITAEPGDVISCTITMNAGSSHGFALWVDFDQDGLDAEDKMFGTSSYNSGPYSSSFTIPANTPAGEYRLRILGDYNTSAPSNPCGSYKDGEAEDYKLVVTIPPCKKPSGLTKDGTTAHTATLHWTNGEEGQDAWQIAYSTSSTFAPADEFTPGENEWLVDVTENPATIEGLAQSTTYYAYVRANCGSPDGMSNWCTTKATFSTIEGNKVPTDLAISSISTTTATASWNGVATNVLHESYELYISTESTSPAAEPEAGPNYITGITETTYPFTGLEAGNTYNVWVRDYCGTDGYSAWSAKKSFDTDCVPFEIESTGWTEDFESYPAVTYNVQGSLPICWNSIYAGADPKYDAKVSNYTTMAPTGSGKYLFISAGTGANNGSPNYAIMPVISNSYNNLTVEFDYKYQSISSVLTFGYLTNKTDATTFAVIEDVPTNNSTAKQHYTKSLSGLNIPAGAYLAWKFSESTNNYKYIGIDNLFIKDVTTFINPPTNPEISDVTSNSASFGWDANDETAWKVQFSSDNQSTWSDAVNVSINTCTLTLEPNKTYYVRVCAVRGENTSSWCVSESFTTDCGPISVATEAYSYDFETELKWNCWKVLTGTSSIQNVTSTSYASYYHSATHYLQFIGTTSNVIVLPEFEEEINTLQISFWHRPESNSAPSSTNNYSGKFAVGYLTDLTDASTFQAIETFVATDWASSPTHEQYTCYFDAVPDGAHIAFRQFDCSTNWYWFVDDVEVSLAPACRPVKNLAATNVTNHSATITWTKGTEDQDAWQLKYNKTVDFNPDEAGTLVDNLDATTCTFDKTLDAASVYYIYVRANCGGTAGNSPWTKTTISTGAAAPAPTAFNKKEVGPDWVDLYWTAPAGDLLSGYGIYYQDAVTPPPTADTPATKTIDDATAPTSDSPYRLTGLANEHTYYLWVRANHEEGVYSAWTQLADPYYITTLVACPTPTALTAINITNTTADLTWTGYSDSYTVQYQTAAYTEEYFFEDFEDGIPSTWTILTEGTAPNTNGWVTTTDGGSKVAVSYSYLSSTNYNANNWLISPKLNLQGTLKFKVRDNDDSTWNDEFEVLLSTTGTATADFTTTLRTMQSPSKTFTEIPIDLSSYAEQQGYIAIHHVSSGQYYIMVDDFGIYGNEVPAGDWKVATTTATNGEYTLEGLSQNTKYDVRVKGNCEGGEYSDVESFTTYTAFTKTIDKHGNNIEDGGWYLIASPVVEAITPSTNNGFITSNSYDLYRFNQAPTANSQGEYLEWENYKKHGFAIESGKGYLYASGEENGTELKFIGTPYSGNGEVSLTYSTDNPDSRMHGWNLIGNPFSTAATLDLPFYQMNGTQTALEAKTEGNIPAMEGVFVYAYDQATSQAIATAQFTPASRSAHAPQGIMNISVLLNRGAEVDNAIIRFDEGHTLPKFYFMEQNANLYIPQNGKEYAIVTSEGQGEMPLNFRANKNGSYTLSFGSENVSFSYLHLIDNKTGNDIDLLQTPSYTFNATTTDYESRFKLVFAAGASTSSETFAFFSNGNWLIANEGKATLQVVDVMGRILSSETINGSVSKAINAVPGVYMLRLVNGNDVKTQKVVVR